MMLSEMNTNNNSTDYRSIRIISRSCKLIIHYILLIGLFALTPVYGLPQFALLTGNKCITCHINAQGGGLRNFRGWREYSDKSLIKPDRIGLEKLYAHDMKSNSLFTNRLTLGADFRLQSARSHNSPESKRRLFPMQAAAYSSARLTGFLDCEGSYNFGPRKFFGQQKWSASFIVHPRYSFTQLRIGYFQPSIGVRYDDHTLLVGQVAGTDGTTIIPVNYAEYGAEVNVNRYKWMTLSAGVFGAKSLEENRITGSDGTEISLIKDSNNPSLLGRVDFRGTRLKGFLNANAGGSFLKNGDFSLVSLFCGMGFSDRVSVMGNYTISDKKDLRKTKNGMIDITYKVIDSLLLYIRTERGVTNSTFGDVIIETYTNQGAVGTQIFLLPYIELRPEYRMVDTEQFRSTRYAIQLHIFH